MLPWDFWLRGFNQWSEALQAWTQIESVPLVSPPEFFRNVTLRSPIRVACQIGNVVYLSRKS